MIETFTVLSGVLALLAVARQPRNSKAIFWTFTVLLILFYGLRWEMGTDWTTYYAFFADPEAASNFEPGYTLLTRIVQSFTDNYSVFLVIATAITFAGIFQPVFAMTRQSFLSLFYLTGTLPWYAGSMRQMIACVFFTVALKAAMERRLVRYLILMTIGFSFHATVFPFYPMYWLYGISWGSYGILFAGASVVAYFAKDLVRLVDIILGMVLVNKDLVGRIGGTLELSNPVFGFLRKVLTAAGFGVFAHAARASGTLETQERKNIEFTLMLSIFSIILYYIGTYSISHVSSRLDLYLSIIVTSLLIGYLDRGLTRKSNRLLLFGFVTMLVVTFYLRLGPLDLFHPYSSIFYNRDLGRVLNR